MGQLSTSLTVVDNRWWGQDNIRDDEQKALFGEVTIPASDKTDITVGFRKYETENTFDAKDGYFGYYETDPNLGFVGRQELMSINLMTAAWFPNLILLIDQMMIF